VALISRPGHHAVGGQGARARPAVDRGLQESCRARRPAGTVVLRRIAGQGCTCTDRAVPGGLCLQQPPVHSCFQFGTHRRRSGARCGARPIRLSPRSRPVDALNVREGEAQSRSMAIHHTPVARCVRNLMNVPAPTGHGPTANSPRGRRCATNCWPPHPSAQLTSWAPMAIRHQRLPLPRRSCSAIAVARVGS